MNDNNAESSFTPPPQSEKPKSNNKKILVIVPIVLLVLAASSLAYLYLNEKNTNKELIQIVSQFQSVQPTTTDGASKTEEAAIADGKISYVAEVGAFSLNLPNNYRIVEYVDGQEEGGKATRIDVADKSGKGNAVVDDQYFKQVEVFASPENNFETLQKFIDANIEIPDYTKLENRTIAGVDARAFSVPGLYVSNYYFFEKNGIHYMISGTQDNVTKLNDVINGFSFVY